MEVVHERCCGLDVHAKTVVACLIVPSPAGKPSKEVRTCGTMTEDLIRLRTWLVEAGCSHVAMESTGVYWKPIYNLLEESELTILVVNAQHIKQVPGRKTDVRDSEWIADLLRHGLLTASFIPDRAQRELRELTRYRTSLVRERSAEINRLQKVLEGANIKLAVVTKDLMGVSAREMVQALVDGGDDAATMAELARGRLRAKLPQLEQALTGRMGPHQRFLLAQQLAHIDALDEQIEQVSTEIAERMRPFEQALTLLDSIPGVARRGAEILVAELGVEMERFPSAGHLASWAGMAPGNNESAGKRRSGKTRKGSPWLRALLVEAAHAAGRTKDSSLGAQYRRLAGRKGKKRAAVAVGHSILVIAYHLLLRQESYQDLGVDYFERRNCQAQERRLFRQAQALGFTVTRQTDQPAA
jgi:transposase